MVPSRMKYLLVFYLVSLATADWLVNKTFHRKDTNGFIFTDDLVFQSAARSKLDCSRHCLSHDPCVTFTFIPGLDNHVSGSCRIHSTAVTSEASPSTVASEGAETYHMSGEQRTDWLNITCTSTAECEALDPGLANVDCIRGRCLCIPGYYYSFSENNCLDSCPEERLAGTFIRYLDCGITGHNTHDQYETTLEECLPDCLALSWCRSVDIYLGDGKCHFQQVAALDDPPSWNGNKLNVNYYQRTCQ